MKINFVSNLYPSREKPFKGTFVRNVLEGFQNRGCEVSLIALQENGNGKLRKLLDYLKFTWQTFYSGLRSEGGQVHYVHYTSHSSLGLILASFFKPKENLFIVSNVHGSDIIPDSSGFFSKVKIFISQKILNISAVVVSPSGYFKEVLFEHYGVSPEKVIVSPSGGVDDSVFFPSSVEGKKEFTFGYVGRLEEGKGIFDLLNAFSSIKQEVPEATLLLLGSGSCESRLNKVMSSMAGVTLLQGKSQKELASIYQSLKFLVFPSKLSESLGLIPIEAMMCGVPVVSSNIGATKDYILSDMSKLSFEPGNVEELKVVLKVATGMAELEYSNLVELAKETANEYSSSKVIDALYQELMSRLKRGSN